MPMVKDYLAASRAPRYSVLFALPLLLLYEIAAYLNTGSAYEGVRNGADVMLILEWFAGRELGWSPGRLDRAYRPQPRAPPQRGTRRSQ